MNFLDPTREPASLSNGQPARPPLSHNQAQLEASRLLDRVPDSDGAKILEVALRDAFIGRIGVLSSFGAESAVLLHLVDGTSADVAGDHAVILAELAAYGGGLAAKPRLTALNKVDALLPEVLAARRAELEAVIGAEVHPVSGVSGAGLTDLLRRLRDEVAAVRRSDSSATVETASWQP